MSNLSFAAFESKKSEVLKTANSLSSLAVSLGALSLNHKIESVVYKLEDGDFNLVIVGEFNHGKTTFINSLLGKSVLPTGVTPTTSLMHFIKWGNKSEAVFCDHNGKAHDIAIDKLSDFAVSSGFKSDGFIELNYPSPLLSDRLVIIDTPGVNDLSQLRSDITYKYIPKADVVVFLLDAGQILKESEKTFLLKIKDQQEKIIFVITKMDLLSIDEQEEVITYTKSKLKELLGKDAVVFGVSALQALAGKDSSGVSEFVSYLSRFLAEQRGNIVLKNALRHCLDLSSMVGKGVEAKRQALVMPIESLRYKISAIESDLEKQGATTLERRESVKEAIDYVRLFVRKDIDIFVEDSIRKSLTEIEKADPNDLKVYFHQYLESLFKEFADNEVHDIKFALDALSNKTIALIKEDAEKTETKLNEVYFNGSLSNLNINVDVFGFDLGVMAVLSLGAIGLSLGYLVFGGAMLAAGPVLGAIAKERSNSEYKRICLEQAPKIIRTAADKIGPKIDEVITEFAENLDKWIVEASEDLHKELLDILCSVKELRYGTESLIEKQKVETLELEKKIVSIQEELLFLNNSF